MGSFFKLRRMCIDVTFGASLKFDPVDRKRFSGDMALRATHHCMFSLQGIAGSCMFFQAERRRLEPPYGMTVRTLGPAFSFGELASVWIGTVTVGAFLECDGALEVSLGVTPHALDLSMPAEQKKLCFRMIKRPT
jgi:hypothetical protein